MNFEYERVVTETQALYERFINDRREIERRRSELFEEFKSQVSHWSLTGPHSNDLEHGFLGQRKTIVSINDEYTEWIKRYNEVHSQVQDAFTPASESDIETRLSDLQRLREMIRTLEPELPRLQKIIDRFEKAVRVLSSFNSSAG